MCNPSAQSDSAEPPEVAVPSRWNAELGFQTLNFGKEIRSQKRGQLMKISAMKQTLNTES